MRETTLDKKVDNSSPQITATAGKYLTFRLAEEGYGVTILKIQEIIGLLSVTRVPRLPDFIRGVINLRGKVIPVVDLRLKFGLSRGEDTDRTCIIVLQILRDNQETTVGILVDEVLEVLDLAEAQIEPPPEFGTIVDTKFLQGMGKVDERVLIILDIDRVLSEQELEATNKAASAVG